MMPATSVQPVVQPHPGRAFSGVWRLTSRRFFTPGQALLLLGTFVLLGGLSLIRIRYGQVGDFFPWIAQFYLGFVIPVMAFISGAAAIRDEMKSGTADYVLTRPVRRSHLVAFKFIAQLVCSQLFYLVVLASLLGLAMAMRVPSIGSAAPRLLIAQVTALTCFSALGFLFGVLSERYLVLGIVYAATVEVGIGRIPTQLSQLSMSHQLGGLLQPLDPTGSVLAPASAAVVVPLLVGYAFVFIGLCAVLFSRREMIGAAGRAT
ncbi:MAG: ABC transporter permease [Opitutus sp.]